MSNTTASDRSGVTASGKAGSLRDQRRQAQDEINRRHILDAAERVFGRSGFHDATVREIATDAEFSTGTLYNLFENKDDVFTHVMDRKGQGLLEALHAAIDQADSPIDQLHALAEAQLEYYSLHRDFYRLILRTAAPSWWTLKADLDDTSDDRFRSALDLESAVFAKGVESGDFRSQDPETMAVLFLGMMQAYLTRWLLRADTATESGCGAYPLSELHALLDRAFKADR